MPPINFPNARVRADHQGADGGRGDLHAVDEGEADSRDDHCLRRDQQGATRAPVHLPGYLPPEEAAQGRDRSQVIKAMRVGLCDAASRWMLKYHEGGRK